MDAVNSFMDIDDAQILDDMCMNKNISITPQLIKTHCIAWVLSILIIVISCFSCRTVYAEELNKEWDRYNISRSKLLADGNSHNLRLKHYRERKDRHNVKTREYNIMVERKAKLQSVIDDANRNEDEVARAFHEWEDVVSWLNGKKEPIKQEGMELADEKRSIDADRIKLDKRIVEIKAWKARLIALQDNSSKFTLSKRTLGEFKSLKNHITDANSRILLGNIFLSIAPFKGLLDGFGIDDAYEISDNNWNKLLTASRSLGIHIRGQLKSFCELEAIAQQNSSQDFRFWLKLSKSFSK